MLGKAARVAGWVLILIGLVLTARWYIAWLDEYLPSELIYYLPGRLGVYLLAILTIPAVPLVIFIEWAWHSWPSGINWGFASWLLGYALLITGRKREPSDSVWTEHE